MGKPAARLGDMHVCPLVNGVVPHVGGPILPPGTPTVLIGGMPAATMGDMCTCTGPPDSIILGSTGVMIGGKPAARMGDMTAHGGNIILGCFTVLIGEAGGGGGGGGAGGGAAPAKADAGKMPAKQAKDKKNTDSLKDAAKNGDDKADKTQKDDFKAKFSLTDSQGKTQSGVKYQIRTSDGKIHDGKTNGSGETENLTGYTAADCKVTFFNK